MCIRPWKSAGSAILDGNHRFRGPGGVVVLTKTVCPGGVRARLGMYGCDKILGYCIQ